MISKYFSWINDYINIEKTCKEYKGIIEQYHFNPIPLNNEKELFELYVYTDIAKNPPKNIKGYPKYHHEKINIEERLAKIKTTNRYFYEFYQDIEKILGTVKDLHLNIINLLFKFFIYS